MLSLLVSQLTASRFVKPEPVGRKPLDGTIQKYRKALQGKDWCDMKQVSDLTGVSVNGLHRTVQALVNHGYLEQKFGKPVAFNRRPILVRWL